MKQSSSHSNSQNGYQQNSQNGYQHNPQPTVSYSAQGGAATQSRVASPPPTMPVNPRIGSSETDRDVSVEPDGGDRPPESKKLGSKLSPSGWWRSLGLRSKGTTLALLIGVTPIVLTGLMSFYASNRELYITAVETQEEQAESLQEKLDIFVQERFGHAQVMAGLSMFADPDLRISTPDQEKVESLNRYIELYEGVYSSIAIFDLNGNVQYQTDGSSRNNIRDQDYFQDVLQSRAATISSPHHAPDGVSYQFAAAAPVMTHLTNELLGVLVAEVPMDHLDEILRFEEDGDQEFHLTDSTGEIVASSSRNKDDTNDSIQNIYPLLAQTLTEVGQSESATVIDRHEGQEQQIVSYAPPQAEQSESARDWGMIVAHPTTVAFAHQRQLLLILLAGTAVTGTLVAVLGKVLAERVAKPIVDAAEAVEHIGQGDLDVRLSAEGEDELADLGNYINGMAVQLGDLLDSQAAVADRQRFLAEVANIDVKTEDDIQTMFAQALDGGRKLLRTNRLVVYKFVADWSGTIIAESVDQGFIQSLNFKVDDPCIPEQIIDSYKEGRVFHTTDIYNANLHPAHTKMLERLGVKANLIVPIMNEGELFGLLVAHHCADVRVWQNDEIDFLKQLSLQLTTSLDRVGFLGKVESARLKSEVLAEEQKALKEGLQKRALELLMEVDPVSRGDLTIRASVKDDEIGTIADSYNSTIESLRRIVTQVQAAASNVADTTTKDEKAIQQLAEGAIQQTQEISIALDRIQEMASSIHMVSANAAEAEEAVRRASQTVQDGDEVMNRTVEGISAIRETVAETAKKVKRLGESSQKISTVVNLIGSFAAQTNLLALNASIEASRAGEEGRGFAVVAEEVRSLAQQSAAATADIEKLVADIQSETNEVVAAMESGTEQVVIGTQLVDETRQSLNKIASASEQINSLVEAIAQATVLQSQVSEEVAKTMEGVSSIADKTSADATSVSTSFRALAEVASQLQDNVGQFKVV
ncbi:MAG: methyl-accepting chemotaxis protein [Elainellaceae cyanobacterium]